jgi:hypothetical protein
MADPDLHRHLEKKMSRERSSSNHFTADESSSNPIDPAVDSVEESFSEEREHS